MDKFKYQFHLGHHNIHVNDIDGMNAKVAMKYTEYVNLKLN
jgi:hypothetical protein